MKLLVALFAVMATAAFAQEQSITLSSTTSTQNSGLYDDLLPQFTKDTGIHVKVVAVGTGQAIRIAKNGDADALLVHHRPSEDAFVADGYGTQRFDVMYNDFVVIGPKSDDISGIDSLNALLRHIHSDQTHPFVSRGDDSGTHKKELQLWSDTLNITPSGAWYREIGSGMGAALNMAAAIDGYTLSDRGTWLSFGNKGGLEIKWSGDQVLLNPYGLILVSPDRFPHINASGAKAFANWMTSEKGQNAIGSFRIEGKQLFCPDSEKSQQDKIEACPAQ